MSHVYKNNRQRILNEPHIYIYKWDFACYIVVYIYIENLSAFSKNCLGNLFLPDYIYIDNKHKYLASNSKC